MTAAAADAPAEIDTCACDGELEDLRRHVADLEQRIAQNEERRRAMIHIMGDLATSNRRLGESRKAMLHILADYEADRSSLAHQTERLDNSRRALLHILSDAHTSNLRLEATRKAMIHIMGDLRDTTREIEERETQLREKQEQLVQAGKLATLGELTTGVAHELNNPLNNIQLLLGNILDMLGADAPEEAKLRQEIEKALTQVGKATQIISHLRTFGRVALVSHDNVEINEVVRRSLLLLQEQLRLRDISVVVDLAEEPLQVVGNAIQLEQVFLNLLANARDAASGRPERWIRLSSSADPESVSVTVQDSGEGIATGHESRIFDPFFTTKEVGEGTGLGLSITYGIVQEHGGEIRVQSRPEQGGALFTVTLPRLEAGKPDD
jgi:C4-dicarboxylate-specific signal transduction histidine kinase